MNLDKLVYSLILVTTCLFFAGFANGAELKFNTQDFAPFNYDASGIVSGPAADIIRRICSATKIDCSMQLLPWARAQDEVRNGKAHGIFVVGWNEERSKWLYFSPPLLNSEYGFFVRADNPLKFNENSDVQGYAVGVYGPSNTATVLEKIKAEIRDLTIDMTPDDEAAFKKLSVGRVDAVLSDKDVGNDLMRKLGIRNVRYAGRQQILKYYIGFSQKFTEKKLVDQFNTAFRNLHKRGIIQAILSKYKMDAAQLE
jgi:polar amino acid transport system substrate-binding protein